MKLKYKKKFKYKLKDGTKIIFRQITPEDKKMLQKGFDDLSEESIYTRFLRSLSKLSKKQLEYFTEVDQENHVAWGAIHTKLFKSKGIGTCRFIKDKKNPKKAEFAIIIIDKYQGKGLGTEFLALLYILASIHKVKYLYGTALNKNTALMKRYKKIGAKMNISEGEYDFVLPVYKDLSMIPDNKFSILFKKIVSEMKLKIMINNKKTWITSC